MWVYDEYEDELPQELDEWFEGFEKELRTDVTSKYISEWGGHVDALIWLIKEILGE